jgi:bacterioferritin
VKEQFELDLQLEHDAIARLNKAIATCRDVSDNASREMLNAILVSEEEHTDWLETQLELIRQLGEQLYCAQQVG